MFSTWKAEIQLSLPTSEMKNGQSSPYKLCNRRSVNSRRRDNPSVFVPSLSFSTRTSKSFFIASAYFFQQAEEVNGRKFIDFVVRARLQCLFDLFSTLRVYAFARFSGSAPRQCCRRVRPPR